MGVIFLFYIYVCVCVCVCVFYQFKGDFIVGSKRKVGSWRGWGSAEERRKG